MLSMALGAAASSARSERRRASARAATGAVRNTAQQVQTIISGVLIVIVATLAVVIVAGFNSSVDVNESDNPELMGALDAVNSGFASMLELIGPLLLALVAAVIIGVVQQMRGG